MSYIRRLSTATATAEAGDHTDDHSKAAKISYNMMLAVVNNKCDTEIEAFEIVDF